MSLLVVGSAAFDQIATPTDYRERVIGGAGVHFSYAASFFCPVQLLAVVGNDWPIAYTNLLSERNIDLEGLEVRKDEKTFLWSGRYFENMNDRETLDCQLNVLGNFKPILPESYRRAEFVFLGNASPATHLEVLNQVQGANLIVADTMDLWINTAAQELAEVCRRIDGLMLNDSEAQLLTGEKNMLSAGQKILEMGPKFVIIKKGEYGSMFLSRFETFVLPAFPTDRVIDPTGAGDSFAGGFMGYLASVGDVNAETVKKALAYATVIGSFQVEGFSLERLQEISFQNIDDRLEMFRKMTAF